MINRAQRHSASYMHSVKRSYVSQCMDEVFLQSAVTPLVNCGRTQSSAAEIFPVPSCIQCVLIVFFWTAVLTVYRDCNKEQQQQREKERERGMQGAVGGE